MSPRLFLLLADAVVLLHAGFVLFVLAGGLLVLRWPRLAWLHLPTAVWGAWVEFAGLICPLTPLENWLRQIGGGSTYSASFVEQYLMPILYPASLSREMQWLFGSLVIAANALVYAWVAVRRARRGPSRAR